MTKEKIIEKLKEMNSLKENFTSIKAVNVLRQTDVPDINGYLAKVDFTALCLNSIWCDETTRDYYTEENVNKILKYQEEHGDILDFC